MALLRIDGHGGFGNWRICYLPARSQRRERSAGTQVFAPESGQNLQHLRAMGIRCHRHPCFSATTRAHGSISACGWRDAISSRKIPGGAHPWSNQQIHAPGLLGRAPRTTDNRIHRETRPPRCGGRYPCVARYCCCDFLFLGQGAREKSSSKAGIESALIPIARLSGPLPPVQAGHSPSAARSTEWLAATRIYWQYQKYCQQDPRCVPHFTSSLRSGLRSRCLRLIDQLFKKSPIMNHGLAQVFGAGLPPRLTKRTFVG